MSVSLSRLSAAISGFLIFIAGSANPLAAEEAATAISSPALRYEAANACRALSPTYAPDAPRESGSAVRFPGGGKLSFPVAAPCPARVVAFDI